MPHQNVSYTRAHSSAHNSAQAAKQDHSLPIEDQVRLAVEDYQQGVFRSIRQAAAIYNMAHTTVAYRLYRVLPRRDAQIKSRKLSIAKEVALV